MSDDCPKSEATVATSESCELLLEQYKTYVESAEHVSDRRLQMNSFYVTILAGLLALLSLTDKSGFTGIQNAILIAAAALGLITCLVWWVNIGSYKQLNSGKFRVINAMEAKLPYPCFNEEWEILKQGEDRKKYLKLTTVERLIPLIMSLPYLGLLAYGVILSVGRPPVP